MHRRLSSVIALLLLVTIAANAQSFVYTNDGVGGPNTVSGFVVRQDGALVSVPGSPFATGSPTLGGGLYQPAAVVTSPVRRMVFATSGSLSVTAFLVDPSTGSSRRRRLVRPSSRGFGRTMRTVPRSS